MSRYKGTNYEMEVGDTGERGEDQAARRSEKEQQWSACGEGGFGQGPSEIEEEQICEEWCHGAEKGSP